MTRQRQKTTVYIDDQIKLKANIQAIKLGHSLSDVIEVALRNYLKDFEVEDKYKKYSDPELAKFYVEIGTDPDDYFGPPKPAAKASRLGRAL